MQRLHMHSINSGAHKLDVRLLLYRGYHEVESCYSNSGAKQLIYGFFAPLLGSSSAESGPVITCQISRLGTPRARATEPDRDPHLRRGVQAGLLRAPQPRAREKTSCRKSNLCITPKKSISYLHIYNISLWCDRRITS